MAEKVNQAAAMITRCDSCYENLVEHLCALNCHPEQSLFMNATKTATDGNNTGKFKKFSI